MKVSTIGCTSLRPSQSSFKAREFDEDYEYDEIKESKHPHKHSTAQTVKNVGVAVLVGATGVVVTSSLASKLLKKLTSNIELANKLGGKVYKGVSYLSSKVNSIEVKENSKVVKNIKNVLVSLFNKIDKTANKGIDETKANIIKKFKTDADKNILRKATEKVKNDLGINDARNKMVAEMQSKFPEMEEEELMSQADKMLIEKFPEEIKNMASAIKKEYVTNAVDAAKGNKLVTNVLSTVAGISAGAAALEDHDGNGKASGDQIVEAAIKIATTS